MAIINVPQTTSFDVWRQKTNLIALNQGDLERLLFPLSSPLTGTVSSVGVDLTGVGTDFVNELAVGTIVKDITTGQERKIVEIIDATNAKTDTAFSPVLASASLVTVDLITALNSVFLNIQNNNREVLIRAIAMS